MPPMPPTAIPPIPQTAMRPTPQRGMGLIVCIRRPVGEEATRRRHKVGPDQPPVLGAGETAVVDGAGAAVTLADPVVPARGAVVTAAFAPVLSALASVA